MGPQLSIGQAIAGFVAFISSVTFVYCLVTIRDHVDLDSLSREELIKLNKNRGLPPYEQLTPAGKTRTWVGGIAMLIAVGIFGVMVVAKDLAK
jgi:hypothetical protein